jgi:hypothetical protein
MAAILGVLIKKVQHIHVLVNSRLTELLSLTKSSAHAEGMKDQKDSE